MGESLPRHSHVEDSLPRLADFTSEELGEWLSGMNATAGGDILTSDNADIDSATHGTDTAMPHRGIAANANAREYNIAPPPTERLPRYRAAQIFRWLGRGAVSFDEMTDLPAGDRLALARRAVSGIPEIVGTLRSARDDTAKYALKTSDGNIVESVLMRYRHGYSVCVSSQAGCRMGCTFCASSPGGFARGLSPGEMYGQVAAIAREARVRVGNVVVMGIGEPFDNYENTLKFIRLLHDHAETNIGYRKVTVSTCGLLPGILRLADEGLPIGLSVSLHAPNDALRSRLMPVNKRYSIDKLVDGCKIYTERTGRRVTFEYALIEGVNDSAREASELARRIRHMLCHVNLIPVNRTENSGFRPSANVARFADVLARSGIQTTVRRELGADISAACGQLRNKLETGE